MLLLCPHITRSEEYRRSTSIWSRYPIWWYVLLALGVLVALVFFVIFPIYIYLRVFPNMQCAPVSGRG